MTTKKDEVEQVEPTLTCAEIAEAWKISTEAVRKLFDQEEGVLRLGQPSRRIGRKLKRRYMTLRIPVSVFQRVQDRLQKRA